MNKKLFFVFLFTILFLQKGIGSHILGGEMFYQYLGFSGGQYQYKVTLKIYKCCDADSGANCNLLPFPDTLYLGVYNQDPLNPDSNKLLVKFYVLSLTDSSNIDPLPPGENCSTILPFQCIDQGNYVITIDLPPSAGGYYLVSQDYARKQDIINMVTVSPNFKGITWYAFVPPTNIQNNSAIIAELPLSYMCTNDTASYLGTATDADGDILKYSFVHPFNSQTPKTALPSPDTLIWPIDTVPFQSGYNLFQLMGSSGFSSIDSLSGIAEFVAPLVPVSDPDSVDLYIVAVEIKEYRGDTLVGITRRDMDLLFINCPFNTAPVLEANPDSGKLVTTYNLFAGDSICIPVTFTDAEGDSVFLTGINLPAGAALPDAQGDSLLNSTLCWKTSCNQAGNYYPVLKARDKACPSKANYINLAINVAGLKKNDLTGPDSICGVFNSVNYFVPSISGSSYQWFISGGSIIDSSDTSHVTVLWDLFSNVSKISVIELNKNGCISDTFSKSVFIFKDNPQVSIQVVSDNVADDSKVEIHWDVLNAQSFNGVFLLYKKQLPDGLLQFVAQTTVDSFVEESVATDQAVFQYWVKAMNSCGDTLSSLFHNNILLIGTSNETDNTMKISWNKYNNWQWGVGEYEIWRKMDDQSNYTLWSSTHDTTMEFMDGKNAFKNYFRIEAIDNSANLVSWSNELVINFDHYVTIPSSFTPNGDGVNDKFEIQYIDLYPNATVQIFNRWGNKVYSSTDGYNNDWDGGDLPDGVYFYLVDLNDDKNKPFTGPVTIIR